MDKTEDILMPLGCQTAQWEIEPPTHEDSPSVRMVVVDSQFLMRKGLWALLQKNPACVVVGEAACVQEAVELVLRLQPDLAFLSASLPGLDGFTLSREMSSIHHGSKILVLSAVPDRRWIRDAIKAGISGGLLKSDAFAAADPPSGW